MKSSQPATIWKSSSHMWHKDFVQEAGTIRSPEQHSAALHETTSPTELYIIPLMFSNFCNQDGDAAQKINPPDTICSWVAWAHWFIES